MWLATCTGQKSAHLLADFEHVKVNGDDAESSERVDLLGEPPASACERTAATAVRPEVAAGAIQVQYQGGNLTERSAQVMSDPEKVGNQFLRFQIRSPNVRNARGQAEKGRVQLNVYGNRGVHEVRARMRMRLGVGMAAISQYPGQMQWLTISEWWNDGDWTQSSFPFRVSVNLVKSQARSGAPLHFKVHAQTFDRALKKWTPTLWEKIDESFDVPVGKWLDLEYYWREGNTATGQFSLTVTPEGGASHSVFNIVGWTQHPQATEPSGLVNFNPMKLYTSRELINFMKARGQVLEIDWDDLDLSLCAVAGIPLCGHVGGGKR